jgi:hypothetical protein
MPRMMAAQQNSMMRRNHWRDLRARPPPFMMRDVVQGDLALIGFGVDDLMGLLYEPTRMI